MKSPIEVELMNFFISLIDRLGCSVGEMVDCGKGYLPTKRQEERYLIHKEYIGSHNNVLMEFEKVTRYLNKVLGHMSWGSTCGLSFEGSDIFAPNLVGVNNVVDSNGTVFYLTALDNPFEILH